MFVFSTYRLSSFKPLSCLILRTMLALILATDERLIVSYLMRISAQLSFSSSSQKDDSYCGGGASPDCRAGVVSFFHKKWIKHTVRYGTTSTAVSPYLMSKWRHCDIIVKRVTVDTLENSLQSVYFRFFIFWKLTEWRCFVTYLSNDFRSSTSFIF